MGKESKKLKDVPSPSRGKEGEPEKKTESEKTSPNLSSTLVPTNNPLKKLKLQAELDCSPILKTVKDAFGSYFEKTMMDGEEVEPKKVKTQAESGAQEGQSAKKKKKKDKKGPWIFVISLFFLAGLQLPRLCCFFMSYICNGERNSPFVRNLFLYFFCGKKKKKKKKKS